LKNEETQCQKLNKGKSKSAKSYFHRHLAHMLILVINPLFAANAFPMHSKYYPNKLFL